jgi:hypothetical protein
MKIYCIWILVSKCWTLTWESCKFKFCSRYCNKAEQNKIDKGTYANDTKMNLNKKHFWVSFWNQVCTYKSSAIFKKRHIFKKNLHVRWVIIDHHHHNNETKINLTVETFYFRCTGRLHMVWGWLNVNITESGFSETLAPFPFQ